MTSNRLMFQSVPLLGTLGTLEPISPNSRAALIQLIKELPDLSFREYQNRLRTDVGYSLGLGTVFRVVREIAGPQSRKLGRKRNTDNADGNELLKRAVSQMRTHGLLGITPRKSPTWSGAEFPTTYQVLFIAVKSLGQSKSSAPSRAHLDVMIVHPENEHARLALIWRHRNRAPLPSYTKELLKVWRVQILNKDSSRVNTILNFYGSRVIVRLLKSNKAEFFPQFYSVLHGDSNFLPLRAHPAADAARFWLSATIRECADNEKAATGAAFRTAIESQVRNLWAKISSS